MNTETLIDFILHVTFTGFTSYVIYKKWGHRSSAVWGAVIGGMLIDSDHLIDYFLAYGAHFNVSTFLRGYEFLVSNKLHILFHAWEYIAIILLVIVFLDKKRTVMRTFLLSLALSMFFHLTIDTILHKNQLKVYSIAYRASVNFDLDKLSTPEQILRQNKIRKEMELNNVR